MLTLDHPKVTTGSESLRKLSIGIVGAGALGAALCELLARSGVQNVLLIDPGEIESRNLPLSPFLEDALQAVTLDRAKRLSKAEVLAKAVVRNHGLPWHALHAGVADAGWQQLAHCDLICSCTDSSLSRVETAFAACSLGKSMLDGAVLGRGLPEGRVTWFAAQPEAACYLCGLSCDRRAQIFAYAASASLGCTAVEDAPSNTAHLETIQHTAAVLFEEIARLAEGRAPHISQAQRLTAIAEPANKGLLNWQSERLDLPRSQTCPWHDHARGQLLPLCLDTSLDELISAHADGSLVQLAWPVCTRARCRSCLGESEPNARVAHVRHDALCPFCGERGMLEPLSAVSSITRNSYAATQTLRQLGQPEQHLFLLRPTFTVQAGREQEAAA